MRFQGRRRPTEWSGLDRALSIHGADQTAGQPWPIPIPEVGEDGPRLPVMHPDTTLSPPEDPPLAASVTTT
jgi:hypothetical protein